ncbi:MAG TPA: adenosine deaminase [Polyangia bacterium]|jgi:adenosine deaminase|nr:adenosine deaminase [Polyangia bacterium]
MAQPLDPTTELLDLHIHVGGAVAPHILWSIAHEHGFKLPVKSFWEFRDLVTARPETVASLGDYLQILHQWTEKIQSSPHAIERSVYEIIGKEYRSSRVTAIELRFNPMKRNLGGERDLDHIIHAALRGMDRACLEYGCRAGLLFCLAREFSYELNEILVRKAEKYRSRGVIGIDLAGPEVHTVELSENVDAYRELFARARAAGLGTTVHTGETTHTSVRGVQAVIDQLRPSRIGHGLAAAASDDVMAQLAERSITLEICPSSNLRTRAVANLGELKSILSRFDDHGVRYTINTDGPYLLNTHLRSEFNLLLQENVIHPATAQRCIENAQAATFLR